MATVFPGFEKANLKKTTGSAVTLGNFDGVHVGHQAIFKKFHEAAGGLCKVLYTFKPHPKAILSPGAAPAMLTTYEERLEILEQQGFDYIIEEPFHRDFSMMGPERFFMEALVKKLNAKIIVVGYDFGFGQGRSGSLEGLQQLCTREKIRLEVIPQEQVAGVAVSSSRIRSLLATGDVNEAQKLLGTPYFCSGVVLKGEKRGSGLGFPTMNVEFPLAKQPLKYGVYVTTVTIAGQKFPAVTNFGLRPTINDLSKPLLESHVFDFQSDTYGRQIKIEFQSFLREEKRFSNMSELAHQIKVDCESAKKWHAIDA